MSFWQKLRYRILTVLDQIFMILNLPTFTSDLEGRMRRLRHIYYHNPKATVVHGQVRDILHGHVDKPYRAYYERLLSVERLVYANLQRLPDMATYDDLLYQTQRLGDRLAKLIDELQALDHQGASLEAIDPTLAAQVRTQYEALRQQLEDGFVQQAQLPASIQSLAVARTSRESSRLAEQLSNLTLQLEDIAASYDDLDDDPIARALRSETDED